MADSTGEEKYFELVTAVEQLRGRGLHHSAKWATEQLVGLATEVIQRCDAAPLPSSSQPGPRDPAVYMLAKSYFDVNVRSSQHQLGGMSPTVITCRSIAVVRTSSQT
jgi:hypothetical protein